MSNLEWATFGAEVGLKVLKVVADAKSNSELVQATCERDLYKKEVDRLNSRLEKLEREKYSNGNKTKNYFGNRSGYKDSSNSQGSTPHTANVNSPGTSSKGHGLHQSAFQKTSPSASGAYNSSDKNNWKRQDNTSGFNTSRGRGNSRRNKGRGGGRGSTNK